MNIVRIWKDPEYRASLADGELSNLPAHPSGRIQLTDDVLADVQGGLKTEGVMSLGCCGGFTARSYCGSCAPSCASCDGCTIAGCTA